MFLANINEQGFEKEFLLDTSSGSYVLFGFLLKSTNKCALFAIEN
jgi:hypothetical protein